MRSGNASNPLVWGTVAVLICLLVGVDARPAPPETKTNVKPPVAQLADKLELRTNKTEIKVNNPNDTLVVENGDVSDEWELVGDCRKEQTQCEEQKRLLTSNIDYRGDGPNNPITDPPH